VLFCILPNNWSCVPKVHFASKGSIQIVGLSATLPNMPDLSRWLNAALYSTDFRPVDLAIRVCVGRSILKKRDLASDEVVRGDFPVEFEEERKVPDHLKDSNPVCSTKSDFLCDLCLETWLAGGGVLVFCSTKRSCVLESERICKTLSLLKGTSSDFRNRLDSDEDVSKRLVLLAKLAQAPVGLCPSLRTSVPCGVAYHHAGLTLEERNVRSLNSVALDN
jgi:DNA polymerase theta